MKKLLLLGVMLLSTVFTANAQADFVNALTNNNANSPNARAPQGAVRYNRGFYLITAAEMAASGWTTGTPILGVGFTYLDAQDIPTTGNFKIYLENTANTTNTKSSTWATAIGTMTKTHDGNATIPAAAGEFNITFAGGSPFTYTGGGLYVAFEYSNPSGALATIANLASCNNSLTGGFKGAFDNTALAATMGTASAFRPETRLAKSVACARPTNVTFSAVTENSATISWVAPTPAPGSGYDYYYSTSSTAPTTQTSGSTNAGVTTANITPLASGTVYYVWVRSKCSPFSTSAWSLISGFETIYGPATPPYAEGFEANVGGWTLLNAGTGNNWELLTNADAASFGFLASEGTSFIAYSFDADNPANAWIFSRRIAMTAGNQYTISFKYNTPNTATAFPENLKMTIGNDRTVAAQTTTLLNLQNIDVNGIWTTGTANFTATTTGNYIVGLNCYSLNDMNVLAVDDFKISAGIPAGVDEALASQFAVFPNPAANVVTVAGTDALVDAVELIDLNGRTVKTVKLNGVAEAQINISDLSAGVYMMNISSDKGKTTKKIVKQ